MSVVQPARCQAFAPRASKPASQPCRPRSRGLLARSTGDFASISGRHQIPHFSPNAEELEEVRPGECQTRDEACNDVSRFDAGEIHSFVEEISIKKPSERGEMKLSEPLANHTTWGIGGPAAVFLTANTRDQVVNAVSTAYRHGLRVFVLGLGSNTLFDDRGFPGLVLQNRIDYIHREPPSGDIECPKNHKEILLVGGGTRLNALAFKCSEAGLSGLEFAVGIPGSVGGAALMNAGAHGSSMSDVVQSVTFCTSSGEIVRLERDHLGYGYRTSALAGFGQPCVVLEVALELRHDDGALERARQWLADRNATQPVASLSAGCTYRNPACSAAGKLIDECGLKGARIGGAMVSSKHANFLVNAGGATATDMHSLMQMVEACVFREKGVQLCREVVVVPYDED